MDNRPSYKISAAARRGVMGSFYWLMAFAVISMLVGCASAPQNMSVSEADTEALFSQLEALAPPTIQLQRLECRGGRVIVEGVGDTLSDVSGYMLKIADGGWKPSLNRIESHGKQRPFIFTVNSADEKGVLCREGMRRRYPER